LLNTSEIIDSEYINWEFKGIIYLILYKHTMSTN